VTFYRPSHVSGLSTCAPALKGLSDHLVLPHPVRATPITPYARALPLSLRGEQDYLQGHSQGPWVGLVVGGMAGPIALVKGNLSRAVLGCGARAARRGPGPPAWAGCLAGAPVILGPTCGHWGTPTPRLHPQALPLGRSIPLGRGDSVARGWCVAGHAPGPHRRPHSSTDE
jgi:hypothetical protein